MPRKPTAHIPDQSVLRDLLDYDPETGQLTWRTRPVVYFHGGNRSPESEARRWNKSFASKPAMNTLDANGYRQGAIFNKKYGAHRVIWKWMTGDEPDFIDHLNHDRSDNRWVNLRSVSLSENTRNRSLSRNNKTGANGISYCRTRRQFVAAVRLNGKGKTLGRFRTVEEAAAARNDSEEDKKFHPNHGAPK